MPPELLPFVLLLGLAYLLPIVTCVQLARVRTPGADRRYVTLRAATSLHLVSAAITGIAMGIASAPGRSKAVVHGLATAALALYLLAQLLVLAAAAARFEALDSTGPVPGAGRILLCGFILLAHGLVLLVFFQWTSPDFQLNFMM
jgi:hypothetical protein